MDVALGGTFDPVHDGHRALFERAFELGDVTVGLTSDDLAPETRREERSIRSYSERLADLEAELETLSDSTDATFEVKPLREPTGIATEATYDALVVSPETKATAAHINDLRRAADREPLQIEVVDHIEADDGEPISSTRVVRGEIDEHGSLTPERSGRATSEN